MDGGIDTAEQSVDDARSVVIDKHRVRRKVGRGFWALAVVVPLALTAAVGWSYGPQIEDALHAQATSALSGAGIKGVRVVMDGRSVTAKVPTGRDPGKVERVLSAVPGVASVRTTAVYASAAEARVCRSLQKRIDRATHGQRIGFAGTSTRLSADGRRMVVAVGRLLRVCRTAVVTVGGHTDSHTFDGATISLRRARTIAGLLKQQGIGSQRLLPRGFADQFPLDDRDTPAARAHNQRGSVAVTGQ
jgi:outer membrane protein OmpA-like peptidoglycan-associated protein